MKAVQRKPRKTTLGKKVSTEASSRRIRRMAGLVHRIFSDDLLNRVKDPRNTRGRSWKQSLPFLRAALLGMACGCKGLREVERLTDRLSKSVRKLTGIHKRIPDTTMRDFLCKVSINDLQELLYVFGYDAWRRKAFQKREDFPFHVLSMDGKYPSFNDPSDYEYLQHRHEKDTREYLYSVIRTITGTLVTAPGRPILGAVPVPKHTNEMGEFQKAFGDFVRIYGKLFELVMYDAGGASEANAKAVRSAGKHFFFQLADERHEIYKTLEFELADAPVLAKTTEHPSQSERLVREFSMVPNVSTSKDGLVWSSVHSLIKVVSWTMNNGIQSTETKTRYFVTSMDSSRLSPEQWLRLVVLRWGVETSHQILDQTFDEDKRPWFTKEPQGALVVMLLRRLVYTALTLFKVRTQRSEDKQLAPWRELLEDIMDAMKMATEKQVANLSDRTYKVPTVLA